MRLADLLANRHHDALPAHHRSEAQRESDSNLHPRWDERRQTLQQLLIVAGRLGIELLRQLLTLGHLGQRFRDHVDVQTQLATLIRGDSTQVGNATRNIGDYVVHGAQCIDSRRRHRILTQIAR